MTEDNFEDFLKKAAQGYNAPPTHTPREEMWSAIQAQRAAGPRVVYGGGSPMREPSARRFGSMIWLGAAAAALAAYLIESGRGHEIDLPKGAKLELELERALYLLKE